MTTATANRPALTHGLHRLLLPLVLVLVLGVLVNLGASLSRPAEAATTSAGVTGTLGPVTPTITDGCAGLLSLSIGMGTYSSGSCTITFGSTNASGITLSVDDNTQGDSFMPLNASNFADATSDCAAMAASDQVGYKVLSGGSATVNKCTASASGNTQISDIPNDVPGATAADVACTTSANGTQTCPIEVGIFETGPVAPAGTYTGTILFTAA